MNHKTDYERIKKIILTYHKLNNYLKTHNINQEDILNDYSVQWTVTTPLYNIGEQTYQISKEFKSLYPDIPWSKVSGLRHRLVHEYENTNWNIINTIIYESLPTYINQLNFIITNVL